jgi:DNA-binding NtrC family response regulator
MKKLKILIVEDEDMLLELYENSILDALDCQIIKAINGQLAIGILKTSADFDLIISDYKMPSGTGGDLYNFNSTGHNIPFILLSGGYLEDYPEFANFNKLNSKNRFLNKPFKVAMLINEIKTIFSLKP